MAHEKAKALLGELLRDRDSAAALKAQIVAERARRSGSRSLEAFVKQAWPIFEAAPLVWGWHLTALCLFLEAVARREIRYGNVNMPPRAAKSNIFSICWPAWVWIEAPHEQFFFLSHEEGLATEHSIKCRQLVESDWYVNQYRRDPHGSLKWHLADDQNVKRDFVNTKGGRRRALAVKSGIVGKGGSFICGDDLLDVEEGHSPAARDQAWRVWSQAVTTRMNDPQTGCAVLLGQRVDADDPSGRARKTGTYESLIVPNEFDPGKRSVTYHTVTVGQNGHSERVRKVLHEDPRTTEGELFFPHRLSREFTEAAKRALGAAPYAAQYGQDPVAQSQGALWQPEVIERGRVLVCPPLKRVTVNVDPSGSAKKTADEVGIVVVGLGECDCLVAEGGRIEDHAFVLEDLSGRFGPEAWGRRAVDAYWRWEADRLIGEDNFGGQIIEDLVKLIDPRVAYKRVHASRGKRVRAEPVAAVYTGRRAHHVGVHPLLEKQLCTFTAGSSESPGRLDALVWGITELMLGEGNASFGEEQFKAPAPTFGGDPDQQVEDFD